MAKSQQNVGNKAELATLGLDASQPEEEILEKLAGLEFSGQSGVAAARLLGTIVHPRAAQILARAEVASSGELRREIRRALFKLRQRGIEAPVHQSEAPPGRPVAALTAMFSPIDPEGARIVWILKSRREGGVTRLWGLTSETDGLVGATLVNLSRRQLRHESQELERRAGMKLVDGDWRLADFILCEAWRNTPDQRRGQVGNFLAIRAEIIAIAPPAELKHPVYDQVAAEMKAGPSLEFFTEPAAAALRIPSGDVKPYLAEIAQVQQSTLVLNRYQQEERVNAVVERAIGELLDAPKALRMRRRLEDTAYYLAHSGKRQVAGWAAAAAALIRDNADLKRAPFFQQMVRVNLGEQFAHQQEEHKEEVRLVMTPAEAMRQQQRAPRR